MNKEDLLKRLSFLGKDYDSLMSTEKLQETYDNVIKKIHDKEAYKNERDALITSMLGLEHFGILPPGKTALYLSNNKSNSDLKNIIKSLFPNSQSPSNEYPASL